MHMDQNVDFDRLGDLVPGVTTTGVLNEARTTPSVCDDDDDEGGEAGVPVPEVETSTDSVPPDESVRRPPRMETSATFAPYGRLIAGTVGVSASRIAEALGVSAAIIKRLAQPVGSMKMQRWTAFQVYDPALVHTLSDHPEIAKARNRRGSARSDAAANAAATRRSRIVYRLVEWCPAAK